MACAIIQARMSSSRLPGKILKEINGRPMLSYMFERVKAAKGIDKIILATSDDPSDDAVKNLCIAENVDCFRGSLDDVLDRYYQAAKGLDAKVVVRLTGDCPLIDPDMIDAMLNIYEENEYDYVANTTPPKWTVPEGMDIEIFSFENLERLWKEAQKPSEREHVTFYFWQNPEIFSCYLHQLTTDYSKYRLTVDYPEDFEVIKAIIGALYQKDRMFTMEDIIKYLNENQDVMKLNANVKPNQGWESSYQRDEEAGFAKND